MKKDNVKLHNIDTDEKIIEMRMPETLIEEHHSHIAPILGVLLILLVLILGGLYLWGAALTEEQSTEETRVIPNNEPETTRAQADAEILETVSPSDSLDAIETDIESTNLDSLDAELTTMEAELNAALGAE
jgi:uncharacterized protein HemX